MSCQRQSKFFFPKVKETKGPSYNNKLQFATTFPNKLLPLGIIVETFEDIPYHILANTNHPNNKKVLPSYVLPSIFNLFDPLRFYNPQVNNKITDSKFALDFLLKRIDYSINKKKDILFIIPQILSPSIFSLLNELKANYEGFKFYSLSNTDIITNPLAANDILFNKMSLLVPDFSDVDIVLNIGSDFLSSDIFTPFYLSNIDLIRTKIITLENVITLTGMNSRFRFQISEREYEAFLLLLLSKLNNLFKINLIDYFTSKSNAEFRINNIINQILPLLTSSTKVMLIIDPFLNPVIHLLGYLVEYFLNSLFEIKRWVIPFNKKNDIVSFSFKDFQENLTDSNVGIVIFYETNPSDWTFYEIVEQIQRMSKEKIFFFSYYPKEFYKQGFNFIPTPHFLEYWQDYLNIDNSISIQQQIIFPLNKNSVSLIDLLLITLNHFKEEPYRVSGFEYFKKHYKQQLSNEEDLFSSISKGLFEFKDKNIKPETFHIKSQKLNDVFSFLFTHLNSENKLFNNNNNNEIYLTYKFSSKFYDNSYSANPYILELPDPIFGSSWDDFVVLSQEFSNRLQISNNDVVEIVEKNSGKSFKMPVIVSNLVSNDIAFTYLGSSNFYKELLLEELNENPLKVSNFKYETFKFEGKTYFYFKPIILVEIKKTGMKSKVCRLLSLSHISPSLTLNQVLTSANNTNLSIYPYKPIEEKWELYVDVDKCIGCNLCLIACQLENNILIVGKQEISYQRDMYWIRIEKFVGSNHSKQFYFLPVMCQQCDYAPCEPVCPVGATSHSSDGINEMTYNRCIGSRFCMANCPYKVRKFNFDRFDKLKLNFIGEFKNPEVSIRAIGVAEKCNFCIHRIREFQKMEKISNSLSNKFPQTACQEACPTNAIILKKKTNFINYGKSYKKLLMSYNTQPNVIYKIRLDIEQD